MFQKVWASGAVLGSVSDLLGLRLPLPRSRPAQISDGTQDSTFEH